MLAALTAGAVVFARRPRVTLPSDPRRYVPAGARVVVTVDVARLRASGWLDRAGSPTQGRGCEAALLRTVQRVVVVAPRMPVESFALAVQGSFSRGAFLACATSRGGGTLTTARESRDGVEVVRVVPRDPTRSTGSEVVLLPNAVVLLGDPTQVRAMLDAAWPRNTARSDRFALERTRIGEGRLAVGSVEVQPGAELLPGMQGAVGAVLSLDLEGGLNGEASVVCPSAERATTMAATLRENQRTVFAMMPPYALKPLVGSLRIAARSREVRVSFGLGQDETEALAREVSVSFDALSQALGEGR